MTPTLNRSVVGNPSALARRRLLAHRGEPLFYADWLRAVFIHFEVNADALQREVPYQLDLDHGRAYVSLVAFTLRNLRPRLGGWPGALLFKPIATHEFLNLRAYVRHCGEPGIYFLAEWLPNPLSVWLGPPAFGLPYRLGNLAYHHQPGTRTLHGRVTDPGQTASLEYTASIDPATRFLPCDTGSTDEFLLERYTAFTTRGSSRRLFRIWHPPWPQTPIQLALLESSLLTRNFPCFAGARLIGANYSPGIPGVWMGRPRHS